MAGDRAANQAVAGQSPGARSGSTFLCYSALPMAQKAILYGQMICVEIFSKEPSPCRAKSQASPSSVAARATAPRSSASPHSTPQPTPSGDVLIAEVSPEPRAAIEVATGAAIADPFRPTAQLVELLAVRANSCGGAWSRVAG